MKYYSSARLAMLCGGISMLLSFKACFHRINASPPPPDRRLIAYNALTHAQRQMLWGILGSFSSSECDRLSVIANKLTEEDWQVLKNIFGSSESHQDKDAQQENIKCVVSILKIILKEKYTAPRIQTIIKAAAAGSYEHEDVQELLVAINKAHAEETPSPPTNTHTAYEHCSEEEITKKWESKFSEAGLNNSQTKSLQNLLDVFPDKKSTMLALLEESPYQKHFLKVLCKKEPEDQQHLLKGILKLESKNGSLAKKMIAEYEKLNVWDKATIGIVIPNYVPALQSFEKELGEAYQQENPSQ